MANPQIRTLALSAAVANGIALSQAVAGAGNLTLNGSYVTGGIATLPQPRRVASVSANAGDTTQTITVTGTDRYGNAISEVVALNGTTTVFTKQDFLTVSQIAVSAATAGNLTAGTNSTGSSPWANLSNELTPVNVGLGLAFAGTATATVEYTYDDPNGYPDGVFGYDLNPSIVPKVIPVANLMGVAGTAGQVYDGSITIPVWGWRLTISSGTGSVTATGRQGGIAGN